MGPAVERDQSGGADERGVKPCAWTDQVVLSLRSLLRRPQVEHELDDELRFHLEQQIEENIAAGMAPDDARYAARRVL